MSNWVTGEIDTIFFFFINFLSLTHVYPFFFSLISIFLSHHTCLPFFSYLNFSGYICLFRCIRCGMLTASFVNVSFFYWWRCWVEFVILKYSILSPTCESLYPKRDERKKWRGCENQRKKQRSWKEKESDLGCESTSFVIDVWFLYFFISLRVESSDGNHAFDPCPWEVKWVLKEELDCTGSRGLKFFRGIFVFSGV